MMKEQQIVHIRRQAWTAMLQHCIAQKPREACGFLFGDEEAIELFVPISNIHMQPERHYMMDPAQMIRALFAGYYGNQNPAGIAHSHPRTPPIPSAEDMSMSWKGSALHWIVSLSDPQAPQVKAYQYIRQEDGTCSYTSHPIRILE